MRVQGVQLSGTHEFSKSPVEVIRLIAGFGVMGDAHAGETNQHLFHIKKFGAHPNLRQVHLIQSELFDEFSQSGHVVRPGDLGENIATQGLDLLALPTGTRLRLGTEAVIELTGLRNPCHQIESFQAGLLKLCVRPSPSGPIRKAGVMAIVLRGGQVCADDDIHVDLPSEPHHPLIYRTPDTEPT